MNGTNMNQQPSTQRNEVGATGAVLAVLLVLVVVFLGYMLFRNGFNFGT